MDWLWWVGAALALGIVEIFVLDIVLLMFIAGALAGAVAAAFGAPVWLQVVVACATSVVLLLTLWPWVRRKVRERVPLQRTNADAHVGRRAVVVADVTETGGRVKLSGEVWSARLEDDGLPGSPVVAVGAEVMVVRIDGATAVVAPVGAASTA